MFDLSGLDTEFKAGEGNWCELTHPGTGESLGCKLLLAGADSSVYRKNQNRLGMARAKKPKNIPNLEQLTHDSCELLAKCTLNWENLQMDGEQVPYSFEAAMSVYKRFPWLREQAETYIYDRNNYLQD